MKPTALGLIDIMVKNDWVGMQNGDVIDCMITDSSIETLNMSQQEEKPNTTPNPIINVMLYNKLNGMMVFFKIKRTLQFHILVKAFCERTSVDANHARFLFDDRQLVLDQTPQQVY
ncbi:hypothetical protein Dsin_027450, partial [Dipteronia sinensis]